jgi:hypothetical protein
MTDDRATLNYQDFIEDVRSYGMRVTDQCADLIESLTALLKAATDARTQFDHRIEELVAQVEALTAEREELFARGFSAGQQELKDAGKLVVIDSPELVTLKAENAGLKTIVSELRRRLGGGCDANHGGNHSVMKQEKYAYCANCGESLRGERFCHVPRAAINPGRATE